MSIPSLTVVSIDPGPAGLEAAVEPIAAMPAVSCLLVVARATHALSLSPGSSRKTRIVDADALSGAGAARLIDDVATDYLMLVMPGEQVRFIGQNAVERMLAVAEDSGAGLVYSDFKDQVADQLVDHPLIDYQPGGIRDNFDFGPVILVSKRRALHALERDGPIDARLKWGGLYDLRLKLSSVSPILRVPEPLYCRIPVDNRSTGERQFDYVDPLRRDYQIEAEQIATNHLKRIGAYLAPEFLALPDAGRDYPVHASIVIPVRNRERTIRDAVESAVSQKAPFKFNVIVVDNHSGDGTTEILARLAEKHDDMIHFVPRQTGLGVGGCWNEAVYSERCGRIAVQLDSDDLYSDEYALEKIASKFQDGPYAMVIGSYTVVNFDLQKIPPGLIDHREWTRDNGRNNALRISGLGAPRAFFVPVLRRFGFPNTSYGEDYALGLRISREYEIGRIYESVYFARRWEGNSDAELDLATSNRYDAYKDRLRTLEIVARQRMNAE